MKIPKNPQKFYCEKCDYTTFNKKDFTKHVETKKHLSVTNPNNPNKKIPKNPQKFICLCGKVYTHLSTLSTHRKKCVFLENKDVEEENFEKDKIIKYLIKENTEFKEMLLEQNRMLIKVCEKEKQTVTNINSNNKTFNLNVFLNEQCKDAINITDFIDSLQLELSDLEDVGKLGFVEGISSIIIKNLKALDICKRPVHCSDSKREVMYVKDENKWEKENEEKNKIRKAIKYIAHKNTKMLPEFKTKYPDCGKSESKYSDQYNKLVIEVMGGKGDNENEKEDKIIKNIAKEVIIEK